MLKMKTAGSVGSNRRLSIDESEEEEEISRMAITSLQLREEEIEKKKLEAIGKVELQLSRTEEDAKRLAQIWEELEVMADPMKKEVSSARKRIDMVNRDLKSLGQSCQKKEREYREALETFNEKNKERAHLVTLLLELLTESERLRMNKLQELNKTLESMQQH